MANYNARQLDARNIGSSAGIDMGDGELMFGTITQINRKRDEVEIFFLGDEEAVVLKPYDQVDIHLPPAALQGLHAKHAVEHMAEQMDALVGMIGELSSVTPAPLLKAV